MQGGKVTVKSEPAHFLRSKNSKPCVTQSREAGCGAMAVQQHVTTPFYTVYCRLLCREGQKTADHNSVKSDFRNTFTVRFCGKFPVKWWLLRIPTHLTYLATRSCETLKFENNRLTINCLLMLKLCYFDLLTICCRTQATANRSDRL